MSQCNYRHHFRAYNPLSAFNRIGTSISRWCSTDCECPIPRPTENESQNTDSCFLFLTQDEGFTLEPGQAFPFSGRAVVSGDCFLCEEEVAAYCNMNAREERRRRPRRPCRCNCVNECPELVLCCLPIIDEETSSELCMCGSCDASVDRSQCFDFENGVICFAPGVYLIEYDIQLPGALTPPPNGASAINTEVHLVANGMIVPGSGRTIMHSGPNAETVQVKVLYEACEPTCLSLVTTNAITLAPSTPGELLVTMTINGLC